MSAQALTRAVTNLHDLQNLCWQNQESGNASMTSCAEHACKPMAALRLPRQQGSRACFICLRGRCHGTHTYLCTCKISTQMLEFSENALRFRTVLKLLVTAHRSSAQNAVMSPTHTMSSWTSVWKSIKPALCKRRSNALPPVST